LIFDRLTGREVMDFVLYGISHRDCPIEKRELVVFSPHQRSDMLKKMSGETKIQEAVILQTCNRTEFYFYTDDEKGCGDFAASLAGQMRPGAEVIWKKFCRKQTGMDVVGHLFEVAAGLDSQMLGESQVLGQVKDAYSESVAHKMSKLIFNHLFHLAFRAGKAVRSKTDINCGAVSVALAAVELAKKTMDLEGSKIMLVGAGQNASIAAKYLSKLDNSELIIANRSLSNAEALIDRIGKGHAIKLTGIPKVLDEVDLVISTTSCELPIITYQSVRKSLSGRKRPLIAIDIAVPRNIDPKICKFGCVKLYDIDDLKGQIDRNMKKRRCEVPKAKKIVEKFASGFESWMEGLNVVPVIARLNQEIIHLAHNEAARYAKDFKSGNHNAEEKLKLFAESLARKILAEPINFIKGTDYKASDPEHKQAVDLIKKMFLKE